MQYMISDNLKYVIRQFVERTLPLYLFYYTNGIEVGLCDTEGELFINSCWSLADSETLRREKASMEFGYKQWPQGVETVDRILYGKNELTFCGST